MQDLVWSWPDWYLIPAGRLQHTAASVLDRGALASQFEIQLPMPKVSTAGIKQSCYQQHQGSDIPLLCLSPGMCCCLLLEPGCGTSWSSVLGLVWEPTGLPVSEAGKAHRVALLCLQQELVIALCVLFEDFPAMSGRVRRAPGLVCFLSLCMWCLQCLHMQPPCAPAQTLDRILSALGIGSLQPRWHWLLWQKCLSPTISGAGPLVPEPAGCIQKQAGKPGSGWLHLLWLGLLSSTAGLCLLCCALGMSSQERNRKGAPGAVYLPVGAHLVGGNTSRERQSGGAGAALHWRSYWQGPNLPLKEGKSCASLWLVYLMW